LDRRVFPNRFGGEKTRANRGSRVDKMVGSVA
jgi:hypothetical protein